MTLSRFLISTLCAVTVLALQAVPARRGTITVTQPDGTTLEIQRIGDERMHFVATADGHLLTKVDGTYYYGELATDGSVRSTGRIASSSNADQSVQRIQDLDFEAIRSLRAEQRVNPAAARRSIAQSGMGRFTGNFPREGQVRGLVILVEYKDVKFTHPDPKTYFKSLLMEEGFNQYGGTGSAYDYFIQNSGGKFEPQFDVYGPFTLSNNRSYYGGNDAWGNDKYPEKMVTEACNGLNSEINFADYDMDNDGYVDNVFIFYAGQGEADYGSEDCVWPHQWELSSAGSRIKLDGKYIDKYACTNEWGRTTPCGVGTFVHEFSHVMGLPDLYCTSGSEDYTTPGEWSVLDYGPYNNDGRTPPAYSAFERNAMGWCEPTVLDSPTKIELGSILSTNEACIIPTSKDSEFFLLENRQLEEWDKYIPGHGLIIWHIDFVQDIWDSNAVNNTKSHHYVRVVPANNNVNNNAGWAWPGTSKKTEFSPTTTPAMKDWNKKAVEVPLTEITEKNGIITFVVMDGGEKLDAPTATEASSIVTGGFTATWNPVEDATEYLLTVTAIEKGSGAGTETYDGSSLPSGWAKSFNSTYQSAASSGAAIPSLKFDKNDYQLTTGKYDSDITAFSFWYKGNATANSYMTLSALVGSEWKSFDTVEPIDGQSGTYTNTNLPAGTKQIKMVYTKKTGNMAVDDIVVTYGGDREIAVEGYTDRNVGNATSHFVDVSALPYATYAYSVKATDGDRISVGSNRINVDMSDASGVEDVIVDNDSNAPVEYYNLQGIRVENPTSGQVYIRRQGNLTTKVAIK